MRKFAAVLSLTLGLTVPGIANAAPIGLVGCAESGGQFACDISVDDATGYTLLDAASILGLSPEWLVGYTFLLNAGADTTDGILASEVAQALFIHADRIELFTPLYGTFSSILDAAFLGAPTAGQIVGNPTSGGSLQYNGVGLFDTAALVAMPSQIAWGTSSAGGYDTLRVHTVGQTTPVPEPGSLSLLALGAATVFASAKRRRRAAKTA